MQKPAKPTLGSKDGKFSIMEIFRTLQGEGIDLGRETIFMRLSVCNLKCVWCDTKDSWTTAGTKEQLSLNEVVERFHSFDSARELSHYVITGGEPLLHDHSLLAELQNRLAIEGWRYGTFETNGTVIPNGDLIDTNWLFSVSPKLASSQNGEFPKELLLAWLQVAERTKVQWKFVVANKEDALEVAKMIKSVRPKIPQGFPIIFQPEESANNYRELPQLMSDAFAEAGVKPGYLNIRYIPQTHKIYGWR